ncbi:MAG: hypothetical protein ACXWXK_08135, partial [Actinomycetota bacterium]
VFAHDLVRVEEQAGSLLGAFDRAGVPLRLRLGSPCTRARPTKFGILDEQLVDALEIAAKHDLAIDTIHAHVGDGFLSDGLPRLEVAIERVAAMTRRILDAGHHVVEVNAGGGLGVPQAAGERPLDVGAYADLLARHLGSLVGAIGCEPGDYLCKESGVLLAEVVTLDERDGHGSSDWTPATTSRPSGSSTARSSRSCCAVPPMPCRPAEPS